MTGPNLCKGLLFNEKGPGGPGAEVCSRADEGNRTPNLLITNQLLCQLSYVSEPAEKDNRRALRASVQHMPVCRSDQGLSSG